MNDEVAGQRSGGEGIRCCCCCRRRWWPELSMDKAVAGLADCGDQAMQLWVKWTNFFRPISPFVGKRPTPLLMLLTRVPYLFGVTSDTPHFVVTA